MGVLNKLKAYINKIFRRNNFSNLDYLLEETQVKQLPVPETYEHVELPEGEIVPFSYEILDTTSRVSEEKFKHNLEILMKKAKEEGKVDKFMMIRETDFLPTDWEWRVSSKNTNLDKECTLLSYELKKAYALEQSGIEPYRKVAGLRVPNKVSYKQQMEALSKIDKTIGDVLLPPKFRSTKHFTINTPLGLTGDYNLVKLDRDYIIIDNIDAFLNSEYKYSVAYHDAYLDVSHESLPISQAAVVLINDENYERIMSDEKIASTLAQRRVVRFKGDEIMATNMILTEMGVLPSIVGSKYASYDNEIYDILDSSIKNIANENGLFFDKSHGGILSPDKGHFSNYYDEKNRDYMETIEKFVDFLRQKFPEQEELFSECFRFTQSNSSEIVEKVGTTKLLEAINEYNELASNSLKQSLTKYKQDRQNITPEIHRQFVQTINLINDFYKQEVTYTSYEERKQTEDVIQKFIQGETVSEQLEAAKSVCELLLNKEIKQSEPIVEDELISMEQVVRNAIISGISIENVAKSDDIELRQIKQNQLGEVQGEVRND